MPTTSRCFHEIEVSKYRQVKCICQNSAMSLTVSNQNELQALLNTGREEHYQGVRSADARLSQEQLVA